MLDGEVLEKTFGADSDPGGEEPLEVKGTQTHMFRHILEPLSILLPDRAEPEPMLMGRTLFSAVHGVVAIGLEEKLIAVPRRDLDRQIEGLVRLVCRGLAAP